MRGSVVSGGKETGQRPRVAPTGTNGVLLTTYVIVKFVAIPIKSSYEDGYSTPIGGFYVVFRFPIHGQIRSRKACRHPFSHSP